MREREIANLVAAGLSTPEIAQRLTLSPRTVEGHIHHACNKLAVPDRKSLAAFMRRAVATPGRPRNGLRVPPAARRVVGASHSAAEAESLSGNPLATRPFDLASGPRSVHRVTGPTPATRSCQRQAAVQVGENA